MWLGRGDYNAGSWAEALRQAEETANANLTDYLLLADYLEEGASALGLPLQDFVRG
jgi:Protein of unknown function (DUF3775)